MLGSRLGTKWRILALARLLMTIPLEKRSLRSLDTVVVLSDKDRALLHRRGNATRVRVVAPPLDDPEMPPVPRRVQPERPDVLFVGALERIENEDAALWLLSDIWPQVRSEIPGARLTIAGAKPGIRLQHLADGFPDVELTGYVDRLGPYYLRASVVVAPMRLGAGVKLKTIVAMLWGVPVVATEVGAEGVPGPDVFFAVENDSAGLTKALTQVLKAPTSAQEVVARAQAWAQATYNSDTYQQCLDELYG
jgi:glycosyltransferase involved in cell wall biosynthesis